MADQTSDRPPRAEDRRRFLRRSIRGVLPVLAGLGGDPPAANGAGGPGAPATSPPPGNAAAAPDGAKTELDRRHEEFRADNPALTAYPSE